MSSETGTKAIEANPQLAAAIFDALAFIDEALEAEGHDLFNRPMSATNLFIEHFILEVKGASKEKPYQQDWFAIIFAIVTNWYEKKYGEALKKRTDRLVGVVQIHGLPFRVSVPPTYAMPHHSGEASDLCFGPALGPNENPRTWIESPPSLQNLSPEDSSKLDKDLAEITRQLRRINLNLMVTELSPGPFKQFRSVSMSSIRSAAEHLVNGQEGDFGGAVWDTYFALENAVKALIAQAGKTPSFKHSIKDLIKEAQSAGVTINVTHSLAFLPNEWKAIEHRYGLPVPGGYKGTHAIYKRGLDVLEQISSFVASKYKFGDNVVFTLAKPNWFKYFGDE